MISHVTAYTGTDENPGDYRAFRLRDYKLLPDSTGYLSEIIETVYSAYSGLKKLDLNKLPRLGFSINLPIDFFIEFRYEVSYSKGGAIVETLTYREGIEEDEEVLSYNKEDGLKLLTENPDIVIDFLTDDLYDLVNTDLDLVIPRIMPKVFDGMVNIKRVEISKKEEVRKGILSRISEKFFKVDTDSVDDLLLVKKEICKALSNSKDCFLVVSEVPKDFISTDVDIIGILDNSDCSLILDRPTEQEDNFVLLS